GAKKNAASLRARRRVVERSAKGSVELGLDLVQPGGEGGFTGLAGHLAAQDALGGLGGSLRSRGANLGLGLALGLRDLLLGGLGAAGDEVSQLHFGFRREALGLLIGGGDDLGGLGLGGLALGIVLGEQLLGLLTQATGFRQLLRDLLAASVERL